MKVINETKKKFMRADTTQLGHVYEYYGHHILRFHECENQKKVEGYIHFLALDDDSGLTLQENEVVKFIGIAEVTIK